MNRRLGRWVAVVLGLWVNAVAAGATPVVADLEARKDELRELQTRMEAIRDAQRKAQIERGLLSTELRAAEERVGAAAVEIRRADRSIAAAAQRVAELEEQRRGSRAVLDGQRQQLERQLRAAYMLGREEQIKLFFNQQDPARVGRVLGYYGYLNRARVAHMEGIRQELNTLRLVETELEQELVLAQQLRATRSREMARQQEAMNKRRVALAVIDEQLRQAGDDLRRLQEDEQSLQALVRELRAALRELDRARQQRKFAKQRGHLPWPVEGRVVAYFGARRQSGDLRWRGLLIDASEGQPVRAVHSGRVVFSDWLRGFGLLLIVDHGDDYLSIYAHNQALYRQVGQGVGVGEVVAVVGNSGGQEGSGLYFEIRHRGDAIDPAKWLARR